MFISKKIPELLSLIELWVFFLLSSVAWIIGWALILEYTIGGSAVARGISPNLVCNLLSCTISIPSYKMQITWIPLFSVTLLIALV